MFWFLMVSNLLMLGAGVALGWTYGSYFTQFPWRS